ncbi:MAG: 4Fe-4S binding protein, partial [Anaerolineales bacterium]|nr:4Fe-4S binding protein [Anaerolineales bacterium]
MILNVIPEKCTGCMACEVVCSLAHEGKIVPHLSRIRILRSENGSVILPVVCPPCDEKTCIQVCPEEGAIQLT